MNAERLQDQLALEEGERLTAYRDSVGILTVGIGRNCIAKPVEGVTAPGDTITAAQCKALFLEDIDDAIKQLDEHLPWWSALDDVRQNVLLDLCFNMGIRTLLTFNHTLAAIEAGDWPAAVRGMKQSRWAKQVGQRAVRLEAMMATGEWQL